MPVPTSTADQGTNVLTNTVRDVNPGAPVTISTTEKVILGAAGLGAAYVIWKFGFQSPGSVTARDPFHLRRHHKKHRR